MKKCTRCKKKKKISDYPKDSRTKTGMKSHCKECHRKACKEYRIKTRRTKESYIKYKYTSSLQYKVRGTSPSHVQCFEGLDICTKQEFFNWSINHSDFNEIWDAWQRSEREHLLTPTIGRIDTRFGFELWNMEWQTLTEHAKLGSKYG
jgi:hypothetical protein